MEIPIVCPYAVGEKIDLQLNGQIQATATILQIFEPFNSSCTMSVYFETSLPVFGIEGKAILKLFDRRYVAGLRDASGAIPWSPAFETRYARMITDGTPAIVQAHLIKRLRAFDNNLEEPRPMDRVAHENCFQVFCEVAFCGKIRNMFDREVEVYNALRDLQGCEVPQLIAKVKVIERQEFPRPRTPQCLEILGLLSQYQDGFPLAVFPRHAPMKLWRPIIDRTVQVLRKFMDRGVVFESLCSDNVLVKLGDDSDPGVQMCFFSFSKCKFRREFKDEREWAEFQARFWHDMQSS